MIKEALTYDDVQLIPCYSEIRSRQDINLTTQVTKNWNLTIPVIASPMDTVCGEDMAIQMMALGGLGIIHRFMSPSDQKKCVESVFRFRDESLHRSLPISAAVGSNGDYLERSKMLIEAGVDIILIDVAHGHHINVKEAIQEIKSLYPSIDIMAGNISTQESAMDLIEWGADSLRVGIGGGSLCTTRIQTGFGVPNITSISDISSVSKVPVIADGGIRSSGDIAKALAFGASCVMLGSLLSGTEESPGDVIRKDGNLFKRYRGSASMETKVVNGQTIRNIEGESTVVPYKGKVETEIVNLMDGVRSALSYAGAKRINEYKPKWVKVTPAGQIEAKPHLKN